MKRVSKTNDLFLFMGQSNMAGRGVTNEQWTQPAPGMIPGAGYEFRAITDPVRLYEMAEPFGVNENVEGGICEVGMKTGSLVTAFTNAYCVGILSVKAGEIYIDVFASVIDRYCAHGNILDKSN